MWIRATRIIRGQRINLQVKIKWAKYIAYSLTEWIELGKKDQREKHITILISLKDINCNAWNVLVIHRLDVDSAGNYFRHRAQKEKKLCCLLGNRRCTTCVYLGIKRWYGKQKIIFCFMSDLSHCLTWIQTTILLFCITRQVQSGPNTKIV